MILNFVVAWIVSRFTPPSPEEVRHLVQTIRVPRDLSDSDPAA
jgi:cation/acetate symporter